VKCRLTKPSADAENDDASRRLWVVTLRLAGTP
jgi:hypothetical protein